MGRRPGRKAVAAMGLKPEARRLARSLLDAHARRMQQELQRPDLTDAGRLYLAAEATLAIEASAELESEELAR